MKYSLWNRKTKINGLPPSRYLNDEIFKDSNVDIILIYAEDNKTVKQVESKQILSEIYDIDYTLLLDEFMAQYFEKSKIQPE